MAYIRSRQRWNYVQKHNVRLPDEYDLIDHQLAPFWGLSPVILASLQRVMETEALSTGNYFILVNNASGLHAEYARDAHLQPRIGELLKFLGELDEWRHVPPFRAVVSV